MAWSEIAGSTGAAWATVGAAAAAAEAAGDSTVSMTRMIALQARTSGYTMVALVSLSLDSSLMAFPLFCTCTSQNTGKCVSQSKLLLGQDALMDFNLVLYSSLKIETPFCVCPCLDHTRLRRAPALS